MMAVNTARITGAAVTFCFGTVVEILQLYGIPFLGKTYDPLDILMYGTGVVAGIIIDLTIIDNFEKRENT